jgi:DNA adenine methylase
MKSYALFEDDAPEPLVPPRRQVLKWIGNKQRVAGAIAGYFPTDFRRYYEPFVGSGAVLGTLAPRDAVASDVLAPLVQIWQRVQADEAAVLAAYQARWLRFTTQDRKVVYREVRDSYNVSNNADDLLFLARTCYGGVIRFDKQGKMNTPCGVHPAMPTAKLALALAEWRPRLVGTRFVAADFETQIDKAERGDLVYCDPPYQDCGKHIYGAHAFSLDRLFVAIARAQDRGVRVALSIDGSKRSGDWLCNVAIPQGLFAKDREVKLGRSMLRRFQMAGQTLESEHVADRLLTTW